MTVSFVTGPELVTIELLVALAALQPFLRDAWIDRYVLGLTDRQTVALASQANTKLRTLIELEEIAA